MISLSAAHIRIARPTTDMDAAIRFWVEGFGMTLEGRKPSETGTLEEIAFIGWPGGNWHLELVLDRQIVPAPSEEDLLVLYLEGPVEDNLLESIQNAGGRRVSARNPYWDEHGVTITDPDGYFVVLSTRSWS